MSQLDDCPRPILGVGALVTRGDEVLLVQRGHAPMAGEWAVPGGKVEWGETMAAAVRREVWEETGISIEVGERVYIFENIAEDGSYHYVVFDYLACAIKPVKEPVAADDALDARWVSREQLASLPVSKATLDLIAQVFGH